MAMKKEWKRITLCLTSLLLALLFSTACVQAAEMKCYHWQEDPAVKAGGAWFRSVYERPEDDSPWITKIEMSKKSAKSGFKTIISEDSLNGGFATDGKTVYYMRKNLLKTYSVKTGKMAVVKNLKRQQGVYYEFHGVYNNKIWLIARTERFGGQALYSYNLKTKKFKTEMKNFLCYNAAAPMRYVLFSPGRTKSKTKAGATYKLQVFDKKTGKVKTLSKKAYPWWYAAGGGGTKEYSTMGKWIAYGEFNKKKNAWQVIEYKFQNGKTYVLKTLKKGEKLTSIMWAGTSIAYRIDGEEESHFIKAK